MKVLLTIILIAFAMVANAQQNFVTGEVTLKSGEILDGFINDLYWKSTPSYIEFTKPQGDIVKYYPENIQGFTIGQKAVFKSLTIDYDSSSNENGKLSTNQNPTFKKQQVFLKVLVEAGKSLLMWTPKEDHFFTESEGITTELVNHPYRTIIAGQELHVRNKLYITQLKSLFGDCPNVEVPNNLIYNAKVLTELYSKYAVCQHAEAKIYQRKEKVIVRKGLVGTLGYDVMRQGFSGGIGYGVGGFLSVYYPSRVYKYSLYTELGYRKFANQLWEGVDYVGFPYKETHQVQSIKSTVLLRSRLGKSPAGTGQAGYTYFGAGFVCSFGLADLYERGPYKATSAAPFVGIIFNFGGYVSRNIALDFRYERGGQIYYNGYTVIDNRPPKSTGYSSLQASVLIEF